ncbi:MAG: hypothetical protein WBQ18_02325 [Solirubrobacteraceae bacterium]
MARIEVQGDDLVVSLTSLEKLAALRREVRVPLSAVSSACVDPDPWSALRGMRAPGTGIPGVVAYGLRRMTGEAPDFAAVHGRGPAVRVDLCTGAPFGRLLVTDDDPEHALGVIRARCTRPSAH